MFNKELKDEVNTLKTQIQSIKEDVSLKADKQETNSITDFVNLKTKTETLEQRINAIQDAIKTNKQDDNNASSLEIEVLKNNIKTLQENYETLLKDNAVIKAELTKLQTINQNAINSIPEITDKLLASFGSMGGLFNTTDKELLKDKMQDASKILQDEAKQINEPNKKKN